MALLTSLENGGPAGAATGRPRNRRYARAALVAGVGLALGLSVASAGSAAAATCPAGSLSLGNTCIVIARPTPTTTPVTTPPTTAAPLIEVPPVTLPPLAIPPVLSPGTTEVVSAAAQHLLDLANGERQRVGLPSLTSRDDIMAIAVAHSQEMAGKGDIFHSTSFFGSAVKKLLNVAARGENVAYNGDIDSAHARLMASAGHRANILDSRFSVVGFGVVRAADGRYFVTQNFIQPAGAPRAAPVARAAAAPRVAAPAASRKAAMPAAPAPPTTVAAAPPTTTATVPVPVTSPPDPTAVVRLDAAHTAASAATASDHHVHPSLALTALVLLVGAMAACCTVPRRRG